jgi:hypothetical protein
MAVAPNSRDTHNARMSKRTRMQKIMISLMLLWADRKMKDVQKSERIELPLQTVLQVCMFCNTIITNNSPINLQGLPRVIIVKHNELKQVGYKMRIGSTMVGGGHVKCRARSCYVLCRPTFHELLLLQRGQQNIKGKSHGVIWELYFWKTFSEILPLCILGGLELTA